MSTPYYKRNGMFGKAVDSRRDEISLEICSIGYYEWLS